MAASRLAEDVRRCLNNDSKFCSISWCASKFTMSDPTKRPQSRDGRTKSAIARLKTPPEHHLKHGGVAKDDHERKQRVKSARLNRDKHVSSKKVFPRPSSADKERYRTQYARDFEGFRYTLPISARPTSPTRRNNPHPTKQFMVWRVPSREIGVPTEGEFPDISGEFDLEGSFDRMKLPPPRPTSKDYGAYLDRLPSRQSRRGSSAQSDDDYLNDPLPQRPRVGPEIMNRTLRSGNQGALSEWLTRASSDEQHTVLKMLKEAEDSQIKETISDVMQPAAARAVKEWITRADERERDVAVRLFSSLGSRQGHRKRSASEPNIQAPSHQPHFPHPPGQRGSTPRQMMRQPHAPGAGRGGAPWPASLWHYKPIRDAPPQIYHRGALFGAARGEASHYTIHPEWPDYQQSTFTADMVQ